MLQDAHLLFPVCAFGPPSVVFDFFIAVYQSFCSSEYSHLISSTGCRKPFFLLIALLFRDGFIVSLLVLERQSFDYSNAHLPT